MSTVGEMHGKQVNKVILDSGHCYEERRTWIFSDGSGGSEFIWRWGKSSLRKRFRVKTTRVATEGYEGSQGAGSVRANAQERAVLGLPGFKRRQRGCNLVRKSREGQGPGVRLCGEVRPDFLGEMESGMRVQDLIHVSIFI